MEVLEALPDKPNVLLLTHGDEVLNAVRYAHRVLGVRRNVTVLDQNYMQFEWFVSRAKRQKYFAGLTFPGKCVSVQVGRKVSRATSCTLQLRGAGSPNFHFVASQAPPMARATATAS